MQAGRDADEVLFFDADGSGDISERKEYVFTDWDPTATSDPEALRAVFDTNGDGCCKVGLASISQGQPASRFLDSDCSIYSLKSGTEHSSTKEGGRKMDAPRDRADTAVERTLAA